MRTSLKSLAMAGAALALALGSSTPALAAPASTGGGGTSAKLVGVVRLVNGTTAEVQAQYRCTGAPSDLHLWVSVKQSADRTADPRLANPGSGGGVDENGNPTPYKAAAWSQSHGVVGQLKCDGRTHVTKFIVDRSEFGYGTLGRGEAWVQFCLFDANNPASPTGAPVSSMEFMHVR